MFVLWGHFLRLTLLSHVWPQVEKLSPYPTSIIPFHRLIVSGFQRSSLHNFLIKPSEKKWKFSTNPPPLNGLILKISPNSLHNFSLNSLGEKWLFFTKYKIYSASFLNKTLCKKWITSQKTLCYMWFIYLYHEGASGTFPLVDLGVRCLTSSLGLIHAAPMELINRSKYQM